MFLKKRAYFFLVFLLIAENSISQPQEKKSFLEKNSFFADLQLGTGYYADWENVIAFHFGAGVNYSHQKNIFSFKYQYNQALDFFSNFSRYIETYSLLYGRYIFTRKPNIIISSGICYADALERGSGDLGGNGATQLISTSNYKLDYFNYWCVPLEITFSWNNRIGGVGITLFANYNEHTPFVGIAYTFQLGAMKQYKFERKKRPLKVKS